ncbi:hypothetical protein MKX01_040094 [Papaver californicum]|nr:hypothetical protein MKX01_040094 [Papaver californicum]
MAEIVIGPLVEIAADNGIQAFTRQVSYCINYKKSARNLARKVKDLNDMRTDIENRVDAAKKNLDSIKRVVVTWLEKVNKEVDQDEMVMGLMSFIRGEDAEIFNHDQYCKGWCCVLNRHKIGKESEKKIVVIDELLNQGRELGEISDPYSYDVTEIITKSTKSEDSVAFASQEYIRKQVMRALKDARTFSVGIYGMGGVGKTTLKNQIYKQVIEEKLFNAVITIVVSQNVNLRSIQNDTAEALEFPRLKTVNNEITRAALLKERKARKKKSFIPFCHKDCKVLITTRSLEVFLSDEDSWYLFRKNAGDAGDSPALQTVAREVVKECGCLPLALVTVGKALRNKDKLEWEYTANQLKNSNFADIEGIKSKVYILQCFILCCLFPEEYIISVDDLVFGDDGNQFYVKTGLSLQKWPGAGISSTNKCSRLPLFDNNITVLPDQPELPHLLSLSLRRNISLNQIPDGFFESLSTLLSLDTGYTGISSLPLSLSSLFNLCSLDMSSCHYLDLTITLPEETGDLSCFKWLDLSYNRGLTVSPGVISGLTFGEIKDQSCRFANLDEIASLTCLNSITPLDCRLTGSSPFSNSVKVLMTKVENVYLDVCSDLKSVGPLVTNTESCLVILLQNLVGARPGASRIDEYLHRFAHTINCEGKKEKVSDLQSFGSNSKEDDAKSSDLLYIFIIYHVIISISNERSSDHQFQFI